MRRSTPLLLLALAACADLSTDPARLSIEDASFARIHDAEGSHGGTPMMITLTPGAEVPGPGDPNPAAGAVMMMTLNSGQEEVCFKVDFSGLSAPVSNAHIHTGAAGVPGGVLVPLASPAWPAVMDGTVAQCVFAPREVIKAIRKNPTDYYVNIHTSLTGADPEPGRPGGAIRGQITRTQGSNVNQF